MEDGWIEHDGKGMPVPIGTEVDVRYIDGTEEHGIEASIFTNSCFGIPDDWWKHEGLKDEHIIAYRIVRPE